MGGGRGGGGRREDRWGSGRGMMLRRGVSHSGSLAAQNGGRREMRLMGVGMISIVGLCYGW